MNEANMNQRNAADSAGGGQHETTPLIIGGHNLMAVNGGVVGDNDGGRDNDVS